MESNRLSALRTISLRLRGTSVSVLEEMGEETDGVVESVSKMQKKIQALTGIDILTDSGAYKDTYTILYEIGQVWKKMSDIDQAALLELMAGKNRANTLAAILGNMKDLKGAYEDALKAEGSALKENAAYLDSIQGRIDLFTNSLQTMWMNFINTDVVKFIVDLGTMLLKTVDSVGVLTTAFAALGAGMWGKHKLDKMETGPLDFIFDVAPEKIKNEAINFGSVVKTAYNAALTQAFSQPMANGNAIDLLAEFANFDDTNGILGDVVNAFGLDDNNMLTKIISKDQAKEVLDSFDDISDATKDAILGSKLFAESQEDLVGSLSKTPGILDKVKAGITGLVEGIVNFATLHPIITGLTVAVLALAAAWAVYDALTISHEEHLEKLEEQTEALNTIQSKLKSVQSELQTTADRIDELQNKGTLSFVEQEELDLLKEQNAELERQEKILKAQEERTRRQQATEARNAAETDPNFQDHVIGGTSTTYAASQPQTTYDVGMPYAPGLQYRYTEPETTDESTISEITNLGNNYDIALENLKKAQANLDKAENDLASTGADVGSNGWKVLEQKMLDAQAEVDKYNDVLAGYEDEWKTKYSHIGYYEDPTTEDQKWFNDFYRNFQDYVDQRMLIISKDFGASDVLNRVFGPTATDTAKEFKDSFKVAVESGENPSEVINGLLNDVKYEQLLSDLQTKFGITSEVISGYFTQIGESPVAPIEDVAEAAKTYSALVEEVTSYNDILSQTSEIVADNTEVTEEYKEALIKLVGSEEEVNACFDENNKLVVKDAKALNKLIKAAKNNTAQNIKLAKSQAVLDYYELYKEMEVLRNGQAKLTASTVTAIKAKYQEMGALQKTIARYALLEAGLNDVIKTYEEFAEAQTFDGETNYIATIEEMIMALGEAFNTGKLGTETAQVAIRGLIPEDVYKDIEALDTVEEQMAAIYDYFKTGKLAQYFDIVFDEDGNIESAEMKLGNLRKFIEDGLHLDDNGDGINVFEGADWQHFELSEAFLAGLKTHLDEGGDGLQYFADQMGVTKEVALAFFKTIEDHDIEWLMGDYSSLIEQIIPPTLESEIYDTVQALADLDSQLANGTIAPDEYAKKYQELNGSFESLGQNARDQIELYNDLTEQLSEQKKIMDEAAKTLNDPNASEADKDAALTTLTEATVLAQELSGKLKDIELTEVVIQFALDHVDAEIETLKTKIQNQLGEKITIGENGEFTLNVELNSLSADEQRMLDEWKKLWEERHEIEVETDPKDAQTALELIEKSAQSALDVIKSIDGTTIIVNTSSAVKNVNNLTQALKDLAGVEIAEVTVDTPVATTTTPSGGGNKGAKWQDRHYLVHADGTAHASGDWGLAHNEHDSLVGELGPEMVVDPSTGRYYTVGDNGAEFVDLKRGSIIFNHKQTEGLLKNGHIASRGKAYAEGNAHVTLWPYGSSDSQWEGTGYDGPDDPTWDATEALGDALDDAADSVNEFEEILDWIEIRMEEFDERIGLLSAQLENLTTAAEKNAKIDEIIATNQQKYVDTLAGAAYYEEYAQQFLAGMNGSLIAAAKNGAIAITEFTKEQDEATVKAIQNYRDYAQKAADLYQQAEEIIAEVADLAKQAFDNIVTEFENKLSRNDSTIGQYEAYNDLLETDKGFASEELYTKIIEENEAKLKLLAQQRDAMQAELDTGKIKEGTDAWYEAVNAINEVDTEIINIQTEVENLQDSINELHWEKFDLLIKQFQSVSDEAQNLLDILATKDVVDEFGNWTEEGITSLGLYAQQMEVAERQAAEYAEEIEYLNNNWESLGYTQEEYIDKLDELKSGQYDAIDAYNEAKEAIVDLNKTRVEAIKEGIEEEIDAYSELIKKKKELLQAEKDEDDFKQSVTEKEKNISDIRRKLAALEFDNSLAAAAKKKQLSAELAEAEYELQELYADRAYDKEQEALDKELENFEETKNQEIEDWEKYLENVEHVVADSLAIVQENTSQVLETLQTLMTEFGVTITDALINPWKAGSTAIQDYGFKLDVSLTELASRFGLTVDDFAAKLGVTTEVLLSNLGITTEQMGNELNMTMAQFAGNMGLTVDEMADKFGLTTTEMVEKLGWTYQELVNPFGVAASKTIDELEKLAEEYKNILSSITADSEIAIKDVQENIETKEETKKEPEQPSSNPPAPQAQQTSVGSKINAGNAIIYSDSYGGGGGKQYFASDPNYIVLDENNGYVLVRHHSLRSGYTGWFKKSDLPKFASGTTGIKKDQWAILDELGEELQLVPGKNGRLEYVKKGTGIIPADMTKRLMNLALNPQEMLDRNRPTIGASHVVHNEININMDIAEVVHIDHVDHDTLPDLTKAVRKEMDSYMLKVNNAIRSKVR